MLVAVFTSQPKSVATAEAAVQSLLRQTHPPDKILWHYPTFCQRFQMPYPEVPAWTQTYAPRLEVVRCADDGPSTKVVP